MKILLLVFLASKCFSQLTPEILFSKYAHTRDSVFQEVTNIYEWADSVNDNMTSLTAIVEGLVSVTPQDIVDEWFHFKTVNVTTSTATVNYSEFGLTTVYGVIPVVVSTDTDVQDNPFVVIDNYDEDSCGIRLIEGKGVLLAGATVEGSANASTYILLIIIGN